MNKQLKHYRLSREVIGIIKRMARLRKTNQTKIVEDAVLFYGGKINKFLDSKIGPDAKP